MTLSSSIDMVDVAGTLSIPLADRVVATARPGVHVADSGLGAAAARPGQLTPEKLFGIGVEYRVGRRIELRVDSQCFESRSIRATGNRAGSDRSDRRTPAFLETYLRRE